MRKNLILKLLAASFFFSINSSGISGNNGSRSRTETKLAIVRFTEKVTELFYFEKDHWQKGVYVGHSESGEIQTAYKNQLFTHEIAELATILIPSVNGVKLGDLVQTKQGPGIVMAFFLDKKHSALVHQIYTKQKTRENPYKDHYVRDVAKALQTTSHLRWGEEDITLRARDSIFALKGKSHKFVAHTILGFQDDGKPVVLVEDKYSKGYQVLKNSEFAVRMTNSQSRHIDETVISRKDRKFWTVFAVYKNGDLLVHQQTASSRNTFLRMRKSDLGAFEGSSTLVSTESSKTTRRASLTTEGDSTLDEFFIPEGGFDLEHPKKPEIVLKPESAYCEICKVDRNSVELYPCAHVFCADCYPQVLFQCPECKSEPQFVVLRRIEQKP